MERVAPEVQWGGLRPPASLAWPPWEINSAAQRAQLSACPLAGFPRRSAESEPHVFLKLSPPTSLDVSLLMLVLTTPNDALKYTMPLQFTAFWRQSAVMDRAMDASARVQKSSVLAQTLLQPALWGGQAR